MLYYRLVKLTQRRVIMKNFTILLLCVAVSGAYAASGVAWPVEGPVAIIGDDVPTPGSS